MLLGGINGGVGNRTADDHFTVTGTPPIHDRILEAEARARRAKAEYWALLAEADGQAGSRADLHRALFSAWETMVDPIDPNAYAERAHVDRSLTSTEPVSQQILIEILTTTAAWAQLEPAFVAKTAELFAADWADARARLGDTATMADLSRTDTQRRHDAFVILMRQGIGADDTGAAATVNIIVDDETLQEEAERRDARGPNASTS